MAGTAGRSPAGARPSGRRPPPAKADGMRLTRQVVTVLVKQRRTWVARPQELRSRRQTFAARQHPTCLRASFSSAALAFTCKYGGRFHRSAQHRCALFPGSYLFAAQQGCCAFSRQCLASRSALSEASFSSVARFLVWLHETRDTAAVCASPAVPPHYRRRVCRAGDGEDARVWSR